MNWGNNAGGAHGLTWTHTDKVNPKLVAFLMERYVTTNETLQFPERFL